MRTHPVTGKKALYVNPAFTDKIEGPGVEELGGSTALIKRLIGLAKVPEYQCRFRWHKEGDLLMWDNRSLVHYAVADYGEDSGGPRWMDHVATLGSTPLDDEATFLAREEAEQAGGNGSKKSGGP